MLSHPEIQAVWYLNIKLNKGLKLKNVLKLKLIFIGKCNPTIATKMQGKNASEAVGLDEIVLRFCTVG